MKPIPSTIALVVALAVAIPATADAHVTLQPSSAAAGGYTRLDVRVPNETADADTTKVEVEFPDGFASASYEPTPGWTVKVTRIKLAQPIKTDDGEIAEQVSTITWTGHGSQGKIPPGAFEDFGLSVQVPGKPGDTLTFKALQTYSNGEVVRWIGPEGADKPAPTVSVTSAARSDHSAASAPAAQPSANTDSASDTLTVLALVVGALGLAAGIAAIAAARRARDRVVA
jgi:uncharacterized protein YcnI